VTRQPSAIDAAIEAANHTRTHLFPFDLRRWLVLGFAAFLDQCGRGGGAQIPSGGRSFAPPTGGPPDISGPIQWITSHIGLLVVIAACALAIGIAVIALALWIGSRGTFIYIDAVATGRAEIGRPWREHAERAGSLFAWRFAIAMGSLIVILLLLVTGGFLVAGTMHDRIAGGVALAVGLLVLVPLVLLVALTVGLVALALRDFVAPIQLHSRLVCGDAFWVFLPLLKANPAAFLIYLLLKFVFHVALAVLSVMLCCMLCCIVVIPVLMQTLLQPAFFFERAWSLFFLRQFGYDLIGGPAPSAGSTKAAQPPTAPAPVTATQPANAQDTTPGGEEAPPPVNPQREEP
jgi:hypothetical protein